MGHASIEVTRLTGSLGARVEGLDLSRPLPEAQLAELHGALLEHQVVFLRGQHGFDDDAHLDFARRLGEVAVYPLLALVGIDRPLEVIEDHAESPPGADTWHTDVTWIETPPKIGILCALEIPPWGGDTLWASTACAYDALSEPMRGFIDGLVAVHGLDEGFHSRVEAKAGKALADRCRNELGAEVVHPLVRTHPETGRRAIFLGGEFLKRIEGVEPEVSAWLVDFLTRHATQPSFQVRWPWQAGDVVLWDERCTMHRALGDHFPQRRKVRRCTLVGDRPV